MGFFSNVRGFNQIQNLLSEVENTLTDIYREFPTVFRQHSQVTIVDKMNHLVLLSNQIQSIANANSLAVQSATYTFCKKDFTLLELCPAIEGMQQRIAQELLQKGVLIGKFGNTWNFC